MVNLNDLKRKEWGGPVPMPRFSQFAKSMSGNDWGPRPTWMNNNYPFMVALREVVMDEAELFREPRAETDWEKLTMAKTIENQKAEIERLKRDIKGYQIRIQKQSEELRR